MFSFLIPVMAKTHVTFHCNSKGKYVYKLLAKIHVTFQYASKASVSVIFHYTLNNLYLLGNQHLSIGLVIN